MTGGGAVSTTSAANGASLIAEAGTASFPVLSFLSDIMAAYNFARRLKTLGGLTPYEYICKVWTSEPDRFILDPIHQMPGLNT